MTASRSNGMRGGVAGAMPTRPTGWVVGSYKRYADAQRAVDHLADHEFPVEKVTIVGVDLMQVERVVGRLTWGRVLLSGAMSGMWFGLFFGLMIGVFWNQLLPPLLMGLLGGAVFGMVFAAVSYAATAGRRDFASTSQLVANRYDVLCEPDAAERVRDELYRLGMRSASHGDGDAAQRGLQS